ncbi:MAG: CBS domain-containing protein [Nitrospiraceae bacterium]|nr:CBS domain-containing protein [Nitrospiraceae bacterium]
MDEKRDREDLPLEIEVSDEDIYEAMKDIQGYLDITPADLKEIYRLAYRHAFSRITTSVRAKDIMTAKVFSVKETATIQEVADLMAAEGISGLPVLDDNGKVAGVISEKDFLSSMGAKDKTHFMGVVAECLKGGCVALPIRRKKAEDIMSSPPVTVGGEATVTEIARLFAEKNINRVPVTDGEGNLMGIVSRGDIVHAASYKKTG